MGVSGPATSSPGNPKEWVEPAFRGVVTMSELTPINSIQAGRVVGPGTPGRDAQSIIEATPVRRAPDRVEVSSVATYLNRLRQLPIREDKVEAAREQIAAGTLDNPEKFDQALDGLIEDLA